MKSDSNMIELKSKRVTYIIFYDERGLLTIEKIKHEKLGDQIESFNMFTVGLGRFIATLKYLARKFNKPELMKMPLYR